MAYQRKSSDGIKKTLKEKFYALPLKTKCIIGIIALAALVLLWLFDEQLCTLLPDYNLDDAAPNEMTVHFIDVGQGDAALIVMPTGETMLIDAGPDMSQNRLVAYLSHHGVTKLTYAMFSHTHEDHIGGADAVLRAFPTEKVILSSEETASWFFADLLEAAEDTGAECIYARVGQTYTLGDAAFEILGPRGTDYEKGNDYSIVTRLIYGERKFLFTGDAEAYSETEMLAALPKDNFSADVLKLGHHGSSTSTIRAFWDAVSPSYVVASCGKSNDYGHPHRETVAAAKERGVLLLRTDHHGNIRFRTDGKSLTFDYDDRS